MKQRPVVIQGGMGVAVSNWVLARAVSQCGQLGVVSGTALEQMLARRLQDGDPGGHMRRAMDRFPFRAMAQRVWDTYYVPGGKAAGRPYKPLPLRTVDSPRSLIELIVVGNFVEVWLATPLADCEARDRKGLYSLARSGLLENFTGVSAPYEEPQQPTVTVDTTTHTPEEAAEQIAAVLTPEGGN